MVSVVSWTANNQQVQLNDTYDRNTALHKELDSNDSEDSEVQSKILRFLSWPDFMARHQSHNLDISLSVLL